MQEPGQMLVNRSQAKRKGNHGTDYQGGNNDSWVSVFVYFHTGSLPYLSSTLDGILKFEEVQISWVQAKCRCNQRKYQEGDYDNDRIPVFIYFHAKVPLILCVRLPAFQHGFGLRY